MPTRAAAARAVSEPALAGDDLREALLARVRSASAVAWERQDAELDAEVAALEAAGECEVPGEDELAGLAPDPLAGPPDGAFGWLADLPGPLLDEYVQATTRSAGPEPIAAGWWSRAAGDGGGFAAGGMADDLPPGPVLAGLTADRRAAGLGRLTDDELIGMLRAARRLASWSVSLELAAVSDLMHRRIDQEAAGQTGMAEHADAEIAAALTLTGRAAGGLLDLAMALDRLPLTARALEAGTIDLPRAMVIVEELAGLGDEHIAGVEAHVLARAEGRTATKLRAAARRAVIAADPSAARKRKERAQRDARVERWAEQAGTAALAGRDLPPAGALAADQHVSGLARALQASGAAGTMDQLRAQVFMALLTGQPVASLLPSSDTPDVPGGSGLPGGLAPAGMVNLTVPLGTWLGLSQSPGEVPGFGPLDADDSRFLAKAMAAHPRTRWCLTITDENGHPIAHGCARRRHGPPPPGDLVLPTEDSARPIRHRAPPAEGGGPSTGDRAPPTGDRGPPTGDRAPPMGGRAPPMGGRAPPMGGRVPPAEGGGPSTGDRVPPTGDRGPLTGDPAQFPGRPERPAQGPGLAKGPALPRDGRHGPTTGPALPRDGRSGPAANAAGGPWRAAGPGWDAGVAAWMAGLELEWLETGVCAHRRESAGYRPPHSLRHLIRVRQQSCAFPGCGRPARRCDLDHTVPYEAGGRTCECNLAPLCRRHHQCKQTPGWTLEQPRPGVMTWTTPSGRSYTTYPTSYPD